MTLSSASGPAPAQFVLRGSPTRLSNFKEALHVSYMRAIAAASGVVVTVPEIDEGVDLSLTHTSPLHRIERARLDVQLKATEVDDQSDVLKVRVSGERYNYLRIPDPTVPIILVAMSLPSDQGRWVAANRNRLKIRHAAYWINLAGEPETTVAEKTVSVPKSQLLDDVELCRIMKAIGEGRTP